MASDSRALWDDSNWLSWPVVGDQRGRRVLGALSRGAAVFQAVWGEEKKMKQQRRLLFAPYLVPLTPWLWTFLLKGVEQRSGRTTTWKKFLKKKKRSCWGKKLLSGRRRQETLLYGVQCFFFSWRIVGLLHGFDSSNDSVFACAHGDCECLRLDACAGFTERMELASWNCEWMTRRVAGWENVCGLTEDECKGSVCAVSVCVDCLRGGQRVCVREGECPLSARRWNYSFLSKNTGGCVCFSAAIKCAMYYVACLQTYTL